MSQVQPRRPAKPAPPTPKELLGVDEDAVLFIDGNGELIEIAPINHTITWRMTDAQADQFAKSLARVLEARKLRQEQQ